MASATSSGSGTGLNKKVGGVKTKYIVIVAVLVGALVFYFYYKHSAAASSASPAGGLVVNLGGISVTVEGGRHAEDLAQLLREQAPDILQSALRVALARLGIPF